MEAERAARLGILALDTRFPRIPGDVGNRATWPFPVLYDVVPGATPHRVVTQGGDGLLDDFKQAAEVLIEKGADGIATTCGFLSLFQAELANHINAPVATSSLMQAPFVQRLLPAGRRVGILTVNSKALTRAHLEAAGVDPETPVQGAEEGRELSRVLIGDEPTLNVDLARQDMLDAGDALLAAHDDIGAIVLECTNMGPYARDLADHTGLPVFDVVSFLTWFHAGLAPRRFS
ncbi:MAG: aspartate/glutamate racemase family protein [Rhodospirillaceae bacterium]|jgi:Asp/Glu/hydantoin racemase|nr:aspartate/glutamate racemase family protein [Rhodospirillaceae bacterium]MBT5663856.1 aspartate/glutamate racemase family protein [Rhodospirillaceae bacterium]MBT5810733.1 aspartate/glutamate racemase family protein [Rhodospirillaceae bacterium]